MGAIATREAREDLLPHLSRQTPARGREKGMGIDRGGNRSNAGGPGSVAMDLRRTLASLWRYLFQRRQLDAELREELDLFLADLTEKNIRSGMDAATARRMALLEIGG